MSSASSQTDDNVVLAQKIEAVQRESAALSAAIAGARRLRLLLFLLVAAVAILITGAFYRLGTQVTSEENRQKILEIAQQRLTDNSDQYMKRLEQLYKDTSPALTEAFTEQFKKDLPGYLKGMEQERDQLRQDLQVELTKRLDAHYEKLLAQHDALLKEEIPAANDDERRAKMKQNIDLAVQKLVKRYYIDEMDNQLQTLFKLLDNVPPAGPPDKGTTLGEEFVARWWQLFEHRLSHMETVALR